MNVYRKGTCLNKCPQYDSARIHPLDVVIEELTTTDIELEFGDIIKIEEVK